MASNKLLPRLPVLLAVLSIALVSHRAAGGTLWAFGDSLVDNGNIPRITGVPFPPAPLYVGFRFSNGPTFAEYLPHLLDLNSTVSPRYGAGTNFGVGGALSGIGNNTATLGPLLPGLAQEIDLFQSQGERFGSRDVVAVWAGANDYFDLLGSPTPPTQQQATATVIQDTTNLTTAAQRLINLGARQLLLIRLFQQGPTYPLVVDNRHNMWTSEAKC
jgi:outer membrane lipase/esterase